MQSIITVPTPPSVNQLYATDWKTKRRFESKTYTEWKQQAALAFMLGKQTTGHHKGKVIVTYILSRPNKLSDIGNREKALSDFIVSCGIISDDRKIEKITIGWSESVTGAKIIIDDCQEGDKWP